MGFPRVFVLSLPSSPRRAIITHELNSAGIPFEFVDGVEVGSDRATFLRMWMADHFPDTPGDYATSRLSHGTLGTLLAFMRLFKRIAEDGDVDTPTLVLEDDNVVNRAFDFRHIDWRELHSSSGAPMFTFLSKSSKKYGLWAQLVSREGAQFVIDHVRDVLHTNIAIDFFVWLHPDMTRCNLYTTSGAWLFEQLAPENHPGHSERLRINLRHTGKADDVS